MVVLTVLLSGCGWGAGEGAGEVHISATRDFGGAAVGQRGTRPLRESDTVMRALERAHDVKTRFGGTFVQSLDGVTGGGGRDWFLYVNGTEASKGPADITLRDGDRVWWDLHRWSDGTRIPAVVGSFPQPFTGRAARVVCSTAVAVCRAVRDRLTRAGARISDGEARAVRVLVGPWSEVTDGVPLDGVFARAEGTGVELLDPLGNPRSLLPAGGGLVAAAGEPGAFPTWLVTGADEAGVAAAAAALTEARLANRFALAVTPRGDLALPVR